MRHVLAWVFLWSSLGVLQSAEFSGNVVTVNGRARLQVKADEWLLRGQLIQESVYRSEVEERLKGQVRCLEADLKKHAACVLGVEVGEPVIYPKLRKPELPGFLKFQPPPKPSAGPAVDPITGLPSGVDAPWLMPNLPGMAAPFAVPVGVPAVPLSAIPGGPIQENRVLWNGMVQVSIVVPAGSDQIEKIMGLPCVHQFEASVALAPRLSNRSQMETKAQRMAIHSARRKASVLAGLAGKQIGEVVLIKDNLKEKTLPEAALPAGKVDVYSDLTVSFKLQSHTETPAP